MKKYLHKVNYYETDKMGITHHSNYIRFMEEARVDFLEQIGWPFEKIEECGFGSPVMEIGAAYKKSTVFSDVIEIEVKVLECSPAKLKIGYEMTVRGQVCFTGWSSHCFINKEGRPVIWKREIPDFYNAVASHLENPQKA